MKDQLYKVIQAIVSELTDQPIEFSIDVPEIPEHGDYSTNVALVLSKILKKNPREVAEEITEKLRVKSSKLKVIDRVEVAGPGFINFFVSKEELFSNLNKVLDQKEKFGYSERLKEKKIITEFTDPNPFKEFHIGHVYSNTVGEAISRLIESQGAQVKRVNYQGDVGLHVAKSIYGIMKKCSTPNAHFSSEELNEKLNELESKPLKERAKFLGEAYAFGAQAFEENEEAKSHITELNKKIFAKDPQIMPIYERGKSWSLDYFDGIYQRLGTRFDQLYFESEVGEKGKKIVLENLERNIFEESDGAVIFPGKKYGLHNRVFINSLGLPTYEAKELGLAPAKYDDFAYDTSIIITGNEINEYFKVLLKALELIRPELAERTVHIGHGMVRLPEGKMSSRTGKVITGEWLLDEARERATRKIEETISDRDEHLDKDLVSEKVAVGAVKYALLKHSIGKDIEFSFDESISFVGNSGPYLQYTYVRTRSISEKVKSQKSEVKSENSITTDLKLESEELSVLRHLLHFPEVVEQSAASYAPHYICTYLYELAQKFNVFYQKHKVIGGGQETFRLALTSAVSQVMYNGFMVLGIPVVERM